MNQASFNLLVAVAIYLLSQPAPTGASGACDGAREPDLSKLVRTETLHDSFYNIEPLTEKMKTIESVASAFHNVRHYYLHGQRDCPKWRPENIQYGGTLCPSYSVLNYDENRIPVALVEAKCSCSGCRQHPDAKKNSTLTCEPVKYYTSVFRRVGCQDNVYQYEQVLEPLTVACTCSAPKSTVVGDLAATPRLTDSKRRRRRSFLDLFMK